MLKDGQRFRGKSCADHLQKDVQHAKLEHDESFVVGTYLQKDLKKKNHA
jgi:hypothetical protein